MIPFRLILEKTKNEFMQRYHKIGIRVRLKRIEGVCTRKL